MRDRESLLAEVAATTGFQIGPEDPAIAFVVLSELVLDQVAGRILDGVSGKLTAFEESIQKVDQRAGKSLAQEVRKVAELIRAELHADIDEAGLKASHLVYKVHQAHSRPVLIRWLSVGVASAVGLMLIGLWLGAHFSSHAPLR